MTGENRPATYPRWWAECDDCGTITTWEASDRRGENLPDPSDWEWGAPAFCAVCGASLVVDNSEPERTPDSSRIDGVSLRSLPLRSVIAGPEWDDEVYQKIDEDQWLGVGGENPWDARSLEPRGPFTVLRHGERADLAARLATAEAERP